MVLVAGIPRLRSLGINEILRGRGTEEGALRETKKFTITGRQLGVVPFAFGALSSTGSPFADGMVNRAHGVVRTGTCTDSNGIQEPAVVRTKHQHRSHLIESGARLVILLACSSVARSRTLLFH